MAESETKGDEVVVAVNTDVLEELTALVRKGEPEQVKKILRDRQLQPLDVKEPIEEDCLLHEAAKTGRIAMMEMLINETKGDVNARNLRGYTPLHTAVKYGNEDLVTFLLETGKFEVDARTVPDGETPLFLAIPKKDMYLIEVST